VNHELARYGDLEAISKRLDLEMAEHFESLGPFRFTATMLVYDSGHEFQMIPFDQIVSAEMEQETGDDAAAIIVHTRSGRHYQWYRTWMQGIFNPDETLKKIRAAARLDAKDSTAAAESSVV